MERGRWEGQNIQPLKKVQRLEEEEDMTHKFRNATRFSKMISPIINGLIN